MAIPLPLADFLCGEHRFRPLPQTILLLGRQTIPIDWVDIQRLASKWQLEAPAFERDDRTTFAKQNPEKAWITDSAFFSMLGVKTIHAVDHSGFEGADFVFDVCGQMPDEMAGRWEFIFNGSVLDNVFDTAAAMRNIDRMLAPGGRAAHIETATANEFSYSALSPSWFFDFAMYNDYQDLKVYMGSTRNWEGMIRGPWSMLGFDPTSMAKPNAFSINLGTEIGVLVALAEKGLKTGPAASPIQSHYRSDADWEGCRPTIERFQQSRRPMHMGNHGQWDYIEAYAGAWRSCGIW